MDTAEKYYKKISVFLVFSYLLLFPLGQLLKIPVSFFGLDLRVNLADLAVFASLAVFAMRSTVFPKINKYFTDFFITLSFSLAISFFLLPQKEVLAGSFYFVRLFSYYSFFILIWNLLKEKVVSRFVLSNALVIVALFVAFFGWLQYIFVPNLVDLKYLGWDDHLYRIAGTFLDPAFTAIILVFGALISFGNFSENRQIRWLLLFTVFILSVAFTYNRASFLALASGIFYFGYRYAKQAVKYFLITMFFISLFLVALPRFKSEGTLLERSVSVVSKISNYKETLRVFSTSPLFGVGFNNLCIVRLSVFGGNPASHACSGADSSILFVLATTGVVGFSVFLLLVQKIFVSLGKNRYSKMFATLSIALFADSLFVQSAFYPSVMGYMAILYAISLDSQGRYLS